MADKKLTITISFKHNEKWLYDELTENHSSPGTYAKDCLLAYFNGRTKEAREEKPQKKDKGMSKEDMLSLLS